MGIFSRLFRDSPAMPGEAYGAPGAGNSPWMSVASVALVLGGWFIVTQHIWSNKIEDNATVVVAAAIELESAADSLARSQDATAQDEAEYFREHAAVLRENAEAIGRLHGEIAAEENNEGVGEGLDAIAVSAGDAASTARRAREDAERLPMGEAARAAALLAAAHARDTAQKIQSSVKGIRDIAARDERDFRLRVPLIKPLFVPSPQAVVKRFFSLFSEEFSGGDLPHHIWDSCRRVFLAFILAVLTAAPLGILMGINRHVRGFWDPPIEFYRPIPPLAYLPLTIVWFGIGEVPKILLIYLAIFAPVVINARAGVRSVAIEQIHAAYSMGATKLQVIWHVVLKGAMPEILTGMRIGIAFGWTTLVAAELAAAQAGLGAMIKSASDFLVTDVIFVGIFVIAAIAYFFDMAMRWLDRTAVPWKGKI